MLSQEGRFCKLSETPFPFTCPGQACPIVQILARQVALQLHPHIFFYVQSFNVAKAWIFILSFFRQLKQPAMIE
jgi:hypothetical protein